MSEIPEITSYSLPQAAQLPANVAAWHIDPTRAVLLMHDMQRYFLRKIPFVNLGSELIKNAVLVRERCQAAGVPVAYTAQSGNMTKDQRGLLKDFWGEGMQAEPIDRQVVDELAPDTDDWQFAKWRYSAFHQSSLLQKMLDAGRDQLIICGVYAHIGVLTTAIESFSHNIETFIVADAVADFSESHHLMTLQYAAKCCAVNVLASEVLA